MAITSAWFTRVAISCGAISPRFVVVSGQAVLAVVPGGVMLTLTDCIYVVTTSACMTITGTPRDKEVVSFMLQIRVATLF